MLLVESHYQTYKINMNMEVDLNNNIQDAESVPDRIRHYFGNNPDVAYLAIIGVIALFLIGVIMNWQWVCRPRTWLGNYFVELFGPATFRFWYAVFLILAIIVLLFFYFKVYK